MKLKTALLFLLTLVLVTVITQAQDSIIVISAEIGEDISVEAKNQYHLFPYCSSNNFISTQILLLPDSSYVSRATMKEGPAQARKIMWDIGFIKNQNISEFIFIGVPYVDFVFKF